MELPLDVDDPRITSEFVRAIADWPGSLTLVGVVHEHPASVYRVRHVIEELDPGVLALEIPPLSISTYKQYARDEQVPPTSGGEMSTAIQSAATDEVLGIDGPSASYFATIVRALLKRPDPSLARDVLTTFASVSRFVIESRVRTEPPSRRTGFDFQVEQSDPPTVQAQHERQHVQKSRAFLGSLHQNGTKTALQVENSTRESHMVAKLSRYCRDRDSVAVVGVHHLEALTTQLERRQPRAG